MLRKLIGLIFFIGIWLSVYWIIVNNVIFNIIDYLKKFKLSLIILKDSSLNKIVVIKSLFIKRLNI